jgi:beta-glucosidase
MFEASMPSHDESVSEAASTPQHDEAVEVLLRQLSPLEKVELLTGRGMWRTHAIPRIGIPDIVMTDGTYGVRYSIDQIERDTGGGQDLQEFLNVVRQRARDAETVFGTAKPATCFPNGSSIACSWDIELAHALGEALAAECQHFGVHVLLGPGINIRRTPLAGRSYEYYSEDPVLTGDFAAAVIRGLQGQGVGACLKHFACNNSEIERTTMNSVVDERALREIYLLGFERAIRASDPWTVMSSYNVLNGVQASQHPWLLTHVLREEWGYQGAVVSDWHGIKDRPAALLAGNDLDMPETQVRKSQLAAAVEAGRIPTEVLDTACRRLLALIGKAKRGERREMTCDFERHHTLARRMAAESLVLLKNKGSLLPLALQPGARLVVVGAAALRPVIQGSGSATTKPTRIEVPLEEIRKRAGPQIRVDYFAGYGEEAGDAATLAADALAGAAGADAVMVFVHTDVDYDGEDSDRKDLCLAAGQDHLIGSLARCNPNIVVILATPDAVFMPWLDEVAAVMATFFAGQAMGGAVADVVFGNANPSGKLTTTFPKRIEDTPAFLSYPGEAGQHRYTESLYVGYRYYDRKRIEPLFPFGFGLSYTRFAYSDLRVTPAEVAANCSVSVDFTLTNIGTRQGCEVCQVYVGFPGSRVHRPARELKAFRKMDLAPEASARVRLEIAPRDLKYYDTEQGEWRLEDGEIVVEVGSSSRDIHLSARVACKGDRPRYRTLRLDTQPKFVLENPLARRRFSEFFQHRLGIDATAAAQVLEHCGSSFFGIFITLNYFFRQNFTEQEIAGLLARINAQSRELDLAETVP